LSFFGLPQNNLSPAFLADAVQRLDDIFGDLSHYSVTAPKMLAKVASVTG
jgi:hypothetical protein